MASQKELVAVVSQQMGIPIETVIVIDRYLAEAGLRTRALRGRGNTAMTYSDAANLIIAAAWEANPKDAVRLVKEYRDLAAGRVKELAIDKDALGPTFGQALANMIESVAAHREEFSAPDDAPNHMAADVIMYGPTPRAEIIVFHEGMQKTFEFGPMFGGSGDLRRTVQFSQVTLGFVGEAIADGLLK